MKIRPSLFILLVMPIVLGTPLISSAMEVGIDSALLNFRFVYASQAGSNGFFGPFNRDLGSNDADLASFNGWFKTKGLSGTTAVTSWTRLLLFPYLKFNRAVTLTGTYRINPEDVQDTATALTEGFETAFSRGSWTRLWMTVNTPLGKIYYGKRGFQQGCGLQFSNIEIAEDILDVGRRSVEIFQIESHYGPLTLSAGIYPWRRGSFMYWNFEDQNAARNTHLLGYVRYVSGNIDVGTGTFYWTFDEGPESQLTGQLRFLTPPSTTCGTEGWIYAKYSNGRVFLNTEADWYYETIRSQSSLDGTFFGEPAVPYAGGGSRFAPKYTESWRYMTEFGAFSGPMKVSFLIAHLPGPDRRHGIPIDRQPFVQEPEKSAYGVFYPYCILMAKYYKAGVNSYSDMSASDVLAAQIQYMVASNLDISASIMTARRNGGYGLGHIRPALDKSGNVSFADRGTFSDPIPTIPDNNLGWEMNFGLSWKLLENWIVYLRAAYWQPGKWFNSACADRSVPNWNTPSSNNNWGVRADRTIDPVRGLELYINAKF